MYKIPGCEYFFTEEQAIRGNAMKAAIRTSGYEPALVIPISVAVALGGAILIPAWWGLPWGVEQWVAVATKILSLASGS